MIRDPMTNARPPAAAAPRPPEAADERPFSPGLAGVVGAESAIGLVDGGAGRLLYRGYRVGELVEHGTYAEVAGLLWTGEGHRGAELEPAPGPKPLLPPPRQLPREASPM